MLADAGREDQGVDGRLSLKSINAAPFGVAPHGVAPRRPLSEDMLPAPVSPYGVSKLAAEQLAVAHARRPGSGLTTVSLRYFTVYGPRQRDDMLISRLLRASLTGTPVTVFGDGRQRRDFTFVGDVVRGNLLAMTADVESAVVNLGTGTSVTVLELLDLAHEVTGRPVAREHAAAEAGDVPFTQASSSTEPMPVLPASTTWRASDSPPLRL